MASKKNCGSSKKAARGTSHDEEWVLSISSEEALNNLVFHGILPDRVNGGWHLAAGEEFLTPHTNELVVFEDYFFRGFSVPIHPFLCGLIAYYGIDHCNLSPNSILHVASFINLYETNLGILPHFGLFRHFFCLKVKGRTRSRVVGGAYYSCGMG